MTSEDDKARETEIMPVDKGYIKLYKNSKGYNWEIKVFTENNEKVEDLVKRQVEIDLNLRQEFDNE